MNFANFNSMTSYMLINIIDMYTTEFYSSHRLTLKCFTLIEQLSDHESFVQSMFNILVNTVFSSFS